MGHRGVRRLVLLTFFPGGILGAVGCREFT